MKRVIPKSKKVISCALLLCALVLSTLSGIDMVTAHPTGGVPAAYADGTNGVNPPPDLGPGSTSTPTPSP